MFKFLGVDLQQNLAWTTTKHRFAAKARARLPILKKAMSKVCLLTLVSLVVGDTDQTHLGVCGRGVEWRQLARSRQDPERSGQNHPRAFQNYVSRGGEGRARVVIVER